MYINGSVKYAKERLHEELTEFFYDPNSLALKNYKQRFSTFEIIKKDISNYYFQLLDLQKNIRLDQGIAPFSINNLKNYVEYAVFKKLNITRDTLTLLKGFYNKEDMLKEYLIGLNTLYNNLKIAQDALTIARAAFNIAGGAPTSNTNTYLQITNISTDKTMLKPIYKQSGKNTVRYKGEYMLVSKYKLMRAKHYRGRAEFKIIKA